MTSSNLSCANHNSTLLLTPCFAYFILFLVTGVGDGILLLFRVGDGTMFGSGGGIGIVVGEVVVGDVVDGEVVVGADG